jgi:hypothetical protein
MFAIFPSLAGMSLTKLSLDGNNLIFFFFYYLNKKNRKTTKKSQKPLEGIENYKKKMLRNK